MKNESPLKILTVSLGVCFVCAVLVSTTTVILKSRQQQNQERDKLVNILAVGGLTTDKKEDLQAVFNKYVRAEIIDLKKGIPIPSDSLPEPLQPDHFDIKAVAKSRYTDTLKTHEDLAQIKQCPDFMIIYQVIKGDSICRTIFPVYGKGLWSTLYGLIALGPDLKTIEAFGFYEHGETPGLGGEVDNPRWKALWKGKQAFDDSDSLRIEVIKGKVDTISRNARYQVDGLTGSTLTTRGVNNLVRFWLGKRGYGPYIANQRENRKGLD